MPSPSSPASHRHSTRSPRFRAGSLRPAQSSLVAAKSRRALVRWAATLQRTRPLPEMVSLSTNAAHGVFDCATHDSILKGDDAPTSVQAVLDVLAAVRDGTPVH